MVSQALLDGKQTGKDRKMGKIEHVRKTVQKSAKGPSEWKPARLSW